MTLLTTLDPASAASMKKGLSIRTGKLMLCWITKRFGKAASVSSNTYCILLVMVLRKTYGLKTFLTAKTVYRITGIRSLYQTVYMLFVVPSEEHVLMQFSTEYLHTFIMSTVYVQCVCSCC